MMDPKYHAQRKKIVNHLYSTTFIAKSEKYIESVIELFFSRIKEFAASGETFDLMHWLQMFVHPQKADRTETHVIYKVRIRRSGRAVPQPKTWISRAPRRL